MIRLARPYTDMGEERAVLEVMASGQLAQGPRVAEFEQRFAAVSGTRHAIAVSSGTSALYLALLANGIGPGDEVITVSFSFVATANSILAVGATPAFVDIDEDTFNMDPGQLEARITDRTRAIMPVHLYGNPVDMNSVSQIAKEHGLVVIEDCAQAIGASVEERGVGTFGTGCFSLYATKNVCTGEGGVVTTDDPDVAERCRVLRHHGLRARDTCEVLSLNHRMTDLEAAVGLVQMGKLSHITEKRQENAAALSLRIRNPRVVLPTVRPCTRHVFHQYTVRIPEERDRAAERLRSAGVDVGVFYSIPIHLQPLYRRLGLSPGLPKTEEAAGQVLSLPVHPWLTEQDLDKIAEEMNRI